MHEEISGVEDFDWTGTGAIGKPEEGHLPVARGSTADVQGPVGPGRNQARRKGVVRTVKGAACEGSRRV